MKASSLSRLGGWVSCAVLTAAGWAAETPGPSLSLSLRGVRDGTVEQGEPLAVAVRISVSPRATAPIELAPAGGAWTDSIQVEVCRDPTAPALAKGAVVGQPESARITVTAQSPGGGVWLIPSASMQALPPGGYIVRGRLGVNDGAAWKGRAEAGPLRLVVVAPSTLPARISQRVGARAFESAAAGRLEQAAGILDAQLELTPEDRTLLLMRAALSERAGNLTAALFLANRASRRVPPGSLPPADLVATQRRLQAGLLGPSPTGEPPAWSRVPVFLLPAASAASAGPPKSTSAGSSPPPPPSTGPAAKAGVAGPAPVPVADGATAVKPRANGQPVPANELRDAVVRADPAGQWAATAQAKSSYSNPNYGPAKATGAPDVAAAGDSVDAWCPGQQSGGTDWLEVTFAKPTRAVEVRVRQNQNPGAIVRVEATTAEGATHVWWEGRDPHAAPAAAGITWFAVRVPATTYAVARVRLTLDLAAVPGWKQIDAVQLVSAP